MKVGGRGRLVAVVAGLFVLVVCTPLAVKRWDRIVDWYQLRRLVGTWEDRQMELLVDRDSFGFYVTVLSQEITVTNDRHMVVTSPFRDGPKTLRFPLSVEGDKLKLHKPGGESAFEFSFGFSDSGNLFLDDDIMRGDLSQHSALF